MKTNKITLKYGGKRVFISRRIGSICVLVFLTLFILVYVSEIVVKDLYSFTIKTVETGSQMSENSVEQKPKPGRKHIQLPEYSFEQEPTPGDKNIIFLETRCLLNHGGPFSQKGLQLHPRQACVLESAAKMNPEYKVYLLYTCPIIDGLKASTEYVKAALTYSNVKTWQIDISRELSKTPLEDWDFENAIIISEWPNEHASDVLRFLVMWKYGGTYLDLDVIVLKSIGALPVNYVGLESSEMVASCVLSFDHSGVGHELATMCLEELRDNFRGDVWTHNGPGLITRILLKHCNVSEVRYLTTQNCKGFNIFSDKVFFPIPYTEWRVLFDEAQATSTMLRFRDSYGVHFWNKLSKQTAIKVHSKQPFSLVMQNACPRVVQEVVDEM